MQGIEVAIRGAVLSVAVLVGGCLAGCDAAPPSNARARLAQLEAQGSALNEVADGLEMRLLAGQARVREWDELARRHQEVSALSCHVSQGHLEEMARLLEYQDDKSRRKAQGEQVVAQARFRTHPE